MQYFIDYDHSEPTFYFSLFGDSYIVSATSLDEAIEVFCDSDLLPVGALTPLDEVDESDIQYMDDTCILNGACVYVHFEEVTVYELQATFEAGKTLINGMYPVR